MRLSSLEIQGFKSFPDKTRLEFGSGITAVVGPNGSGKSNIADAVRWVFGEQSTKTLRGNKMEDVIFGGTQTRKPVGYASVQLTIDNADGAMDGQSDEITISRRLYRSGESEYRINGVAARLKDVHELFMDTGLGRDGYSIIGQGRIADIVSAKSGQRREIFEEAAGIAKFRYRRAEAERKLEQAQENLLRLNDILSELEGRVEPLRVQSEKAKKFLLYAEERKTLEVSLWAIDLGVLKNRLSEQENKVYICKNDYERLEIETENLEEKLNSIYSEMQSCGMEADSLRGEIKTLEERLSQSDSQVAVMQNDILHNTGSIKRLEEELSGEGSSRREEEDLLLAKRQEHENAKSELVRMEGRIEAANERLADQKGQVAKAEESLRELRIRRDSVEKAISDIRLEMAASASLMMENISRLEALRKNSGSHDAAVSEIKGSIEECEQQISETKEQIASLSNMTDGYAIKRQSRQRKRDELVAARDEILAKMRQHGSRAKILEDLEANMEGFMGSVKYILDQSAKGALSGVYGAVSSLISTGEKYTIAIETALGAAMQNIVVENDDTAKRAMRMLQNAKAGRATFLPVTSYRGNALSDGELRGYDGFVGIASALVKTDSRFQKVVDRLLGRVCVMEDLDSGSAMAKATGYQYRIVTLDGQVINTGGSYTGGSTVKNAGILSRRGEIERLRSDAAALEKKAAACEPELRALDEELSRLDAEISGAAGELQSARDEAVRLGFSLEQLKGNLRQEEKNRELAEAELESLATRLKGIEEGEADGTRMMSELEAGASELGEEIASVRERRESLTVGVETTAQQLAELNMAKLAAEKDTESLFGEIERLEDRILGAEQRAERLRAERDSLTAQNADISARIEEISNEKEILSAQAAQYNGQIRDLAAKRAELEASTTELRNRDKETSARREEVSRELARLEERRIAIQGEYDGIIAKLWDEYELTRSTAAEITVEIEDIDSARSRLGELRGKIRALGSVNLEAIDEYEQVNLRYTFLKGQVDDVEEAKNRLRGMIDDLTDEMKSLFRDNFKKIAANFSRIFVELFGGGRAELTLADENNLLETGIDINVQPPGKVIKSLSLLSGGEQSFVAIAIYFAILKVKPSPFCLLDEIEAALDDVNVTRFASYLRQMTGKTQFIAITHRRGTMEEADVLYGVTMQEEGVSKMLELKVSEIENKLGMGAE